MPQNTKPGIRRMVSSVAVLAAIFVLSAVVHAAPAGPCPRNKLALAHLVCTKGTKHKSDNNTTIAFPI